MKKVIAIGAIILLIVFGVGYKNVEASTGNIPKGQKNFIGQINKTNIQMTLNFMGSDIEGIYFYTKYKENIALKGKIDNKGNIKINEYDKESNISGIFSGSYKSDNTIEGTWSKSSGSKKIPFLISEAKEDSSLKSISVKWLGDWTNTMTNQFYSSIITVDCVNSIGFKFSLDANNGANTGTIEDGLAKFVGNKAFFEDKEFGFKMSFILMGSTLKIGQEGEGYFGAGVYVDGDYKRNIKPKTLTLKDIGVFSTDLQEQQFKKIVGSSYERFRDSYQSTSEDQDLDNYNAKVYIGWVRGIAPYFASIIMYTPEGEFWAAVVDDKDIKYYTNTKDKAKLPKTIDNWTKNVEKYPIKYMNK